VIGILFIAKRLLPGVCNKNVMVALIVNAPLGNIVITVN
jgi:hypothetical protein